MVNVLGLFQEEITFSLTVKVFNCLQDIKVLDLHPKVLKVGRDHIHNCLNGTLEKHIPIHLVKSIFISKFLQDINTKLGRNTKHFPVFKHVIEFQVTVLD
jgi:hypothetical protein